LVLKHNNNSKDNNNFFIENDLNSLKANNLYRTLKSVSIEETTTTATIDGRKNIIHLCSNDYLGLSHNSDILRKTIKCIRQISQCSSRLVAGNDPSLTELEEKLAEHRRTESALVYPTGYMANLGVISTLADENTTILSDEFNHSSIIDGCRLSRAYIKVFHHNDTQHLSNEIKAVSQGRKKIVITEGVFSMDGDLSNLREICGIAKDSGSLVIVDDAHSDFIFGESSQKASSSFSSFAGVPSYLGVSNDIDIHTSSLSKGLGCFGGYIATTNTMKELLVNKSRQFIYTSALPEHLCIAALTAIPIALNGHLQKKLFDNFAFFSQRLKQAGFIVPKSHSQIIPIVIGDEKLCVDFANELLSKGVFVQPIRYPTVRKGSARLRVSLSALHSKNQLTTAIDSFESVAKKLGII
jgi:glycine C-acetyltransferase